MVFTKSTLLLIIHAQTISKTKLIIFSNLNNFKIHSTNTSNYLTNTNSTITQTLNSFKQPTFARLQRTHHQISLFHHLLCYRHLIFLFYQDLVHCNNHFFHTKFQIWFLEQNMTPTKVFILIFFHTGCTWLKLKMTRYL